MTCAEEKMCKGAQKVKEKRNPEKLLSYTLRKLCFHKRYFQMQKTFLCQQKKQHACPAKKSTNKVRAGR